MLEQQKAKLETAAAQKVASSIPRSNVLRYSLVRQILWGRVGSKDYGPVRALSGAGQTGVAEKDVKIREWHPTNKAGVSRRGGALVPGWWIVLPERLAEKGDQSAHVKWGAAPTRNSLRIVPYKLAAGYTSSIRNSFYIHGTGGHGSDGCILIEPAHRATLVELVSANGGAWMHAYIAGTELSDALEKSALKGRTA